VSLGAVWGMFEESLVVISLGLAFFVVTFYLHQTSSKALFAQFESWKDEFMDASPRSMDEIKDELLEIVEDTLAGMQPPNAGDHFVGMLGQIAQMWAMRRFNINPQTGMPNPELPEDIADTIIDQFQ